MLNRLLTQIVGVEFQGSTISKSTIFNFVGSECGGAPDRGSVSVSFEAYLAADPFLPHPNIGLQAFSEFI